MAHRRENRALCCADHSRRSWQSSQARLFRNRPPTSRSRGIKISSERFLLRREPKQAKGWAGERLALSYHRHAGARPPEHGPPSGNTRARRRRPPTLLENAGVSENVAADIMGHEKPRITYGLVFRWAASKASKARGALRFRRVVWQCMRVESSSQLPRSAKSKLEHYALQGKGPAPNSRGVSELPSSLDRQVTTNATMSPVTLSYGGAGDRTDERGRSRTPAGKG